MSKSAAAGEMKTKITVKKLTTGIDADGYPTETWTNVFGGNNTVRCKWTPAHGSDLMENNRLGMGQIATATLRFTPLIDQRCRIWHENDAQTDANAWEVISPNDTEDRHAFLELTLKKAVVA